MKMMKKCVVFILFLALLLPAVVSAAAPNNPIQVFVNGEQVAFEIDPIMKNNTTMVQYTTVFKALGLQYEWNQEEKMVTGYNDYILMQVKIGEKIATINNKQVEMDTPAMVINGRTFVPIRFISEATGANVVWDGQKRTIRITSAPAPTELSIWMREHRWGDSITAIMEKESLKRIEKSQYYVSYESADIAGYAAYPTYYFAGDELYSLDYSFELKAASNEDYLIAVGKLYNKLRDHFGEPYRDVAYFYDEGDYHEDVKGLADSIASGEAELTTTWQIGYTEIELAVFSDEKGGIDLYLSLFYSK